MAEEIVQDSLRVRAADGLRDERSIKAWLLTIVRHEHLRRRSRVKSEPVSLEDLTEAEEQELTTEDDLPLEDLRRAIFALDAAYREPLVMQVLQGLSTQQISHRLGLTQTAVLTRLFRARNQLREEFLGTQAGRSATARRR
jgi:RNA polymerase sigma-70 factor (ECF subfamily)